MRIWGEERAWILEPETRQDKRPTIQFTYNSGAASMWDDAGRRTRDENAYVGIRQGETMQSKTR